MATQNGPLFYLPAAYALDEIGVAQPGALLSFFLTDSSTPAPVYANGALTVPLSQPIEALDDGTWPPIYLNPLTTYRVVWTGPDDGINDPEERETFDPVKGAWPAAEDVFVDIAFEYLPEGVTTDQVIGMYVAVRPQRFPGNFDGTGGDAGALASGVVLTPPAVEVDVFCYRNNVTSVGYMRILTSGAIDFFTGGGASFDLDAGEFITWRPNVDDATIANLSWTITGTNIEA